MKAEKELRRETGDNPVEKGENGDKMGDKTEPLAERRTESSENLQRKCITTT